MQHCMTAFGSCWWSKLNRVLLDSLHGIWIAQGGIVGEKKVVESRMIAHDDSVIADLVDIKSIDHAVDSFPTTPCFS